MIKSALETVPILNRAREAFEHSCWSQFFLLIDDSEKENNGRLMGSAGFFKSQIAERKYIFGHNFVLMLASFNPVAVPVGIRPYLKED